MNHWSTVLSQTVKYFNLRWDYYAQSEAVWGLFKFSTTNRSPVCHIWLPNPIAMRYILFWSDTAVLTSLVLNTSCYFNIWPLSQTICWMNASEKERHVIVLACRWLITDYWDKRLSTITCMDQVCDYMCAAGWNGLPALMQLSLLDCWQKENVHRWQTLCHLQ